MKRAQADEGSASESSKHALVPTCLPRSLLDELASEPLFHIDYSIIYNTEWSYSRGESLTGDPNHAFAEYSAVILNRLPSDCIRRRRMGKRAATLKDCTSLHLAAMRGDVALAYECIRFGVDVNRRDCDGATPLLRAMELISAPRSFQAPACKHTQCIARARERVSLGIPRGKRIASILIEHGADAMLADNKNVTPFDHAWVMRDWDLIENLLRSCPLLADYPTPKGSPEDIRWLAFLGRRAKHGPPPPPRRCPCWSGRLLSECHQGAKKLYPAECACPCGLPKRYRDCCSQRDWDFFETWDPQRKRIVITGQTRQHNLVEVIQEHVDVQKVADADDEKDVPSNRADADHKKIVPSSRADEDQVRSFNRFTISLVLSRGLDPAYAWASLHRAVRSFMMPQDQQTDKKDREKRQHAWNAAVDEYIKIVEDGRSPTDIEHKAKVALDGRPLFKRCEAKGCATPNGAGCQLKCCGRCQRIYYCSRQCQRNDWNRHKKACEDRSHPLQMLPSQVIVERAMFDPTSPLDHNSEQVGHDRNSNLRSFFERLHEAGVIDEVPQAIPPSK